VIRNSDLLTGFTDHEVELVALIARYHRKSPPRARHVEFARLDAEDQHLVQILAGMLRIAVGLDRTRHGVVDEVRVTTGDRTLRIEAVAAGDAELELYSAEQRKDLLEDALGVTVEVAEADQSSPSQPGARSTR
jgi:exopolyphosphatase/guanosine-5'-triphosphate,3'-diphosphate pyrophosphatase